MALSCTIFDIFDIEKYCDLLTWSGVTQGTGNIR